jgi:hypothetical protein
VQEDIERAWSAKFKIAWYIILPPLRPELDDQDPCQIMGSCVKLNCFSFNFLTLAEDLPYHSKIGRPCPFLMVWQVLLRPLEAGAHTAGDIRSEHFEPARARKLNEKQFRKTRTLAKLAKTVLKK